MVGFQGQVPTMRDSVVSNEVVVTARNTSGYQDFNFKSAPALDDFVNSRAADGQKMPINYLQNDGVMHNENLASQTQNQLK